MTIGHQYFWSKLSTSVHVMTPLHGGTVIEFKSITYPHWIAFLEMFSWKFIDLIRNTSRLQVHCRRSRTKHSRPKRTLSCLFCVWEPCPSGMKGGPRDYGNQSAHAWWAAARWSSDVVTNNSLHSQTAVTRVWRFVCFLLFFSYSMAVKWCMRWEGGSLSLHFYWLKRFFNLPHPVGMMWEELAFDDTKLYKWIAVAGICSPVPRVTYPTL